MLCGYNLACGLVGLQVAADNAATELAVLSDREPGSRFPPRYRGVFERDLAVRHDQGAGPGALSEPAREMLELRLGTQAAGRLIDCVERMAAAAASIHDDA